MFLRMVFHEALQVAACGAFTFVGDNRLDIFAGVSRCRTCSSMQG